MLITSLALIAAGRSAASLIFELDGLTARMNAPMNLPSTCAGQGIYIHAFASEEFSGILDAINAGRFNLNLLKSGARQLIAVFVFFECSRDAAQPTAEHSCGFRAAFRRESQHRIRPSDRQASVRERLPGARDLCPLRD